MPKTAKPSRSSRPALAMLARAQIAPAGDDAKATRTFRMVANTGEPMRLWPYEHPVVVDLASIDLSGLPVPALYDHHPDVDFVVGQVQAGNVQGSELVAEGVFTATDTGDPDRNYGRKVLDKADAGYQWQVSIGGDPKEVDNIAAGQSVPVNGRTYPGPVCVARGVVLREISFVVLGGDRMTSAVVANGGKNMAAVSFEDFVQSMGFTPGDLDETQAANMRRLHSEMHPEGEEEEKMPEETAAGDSTKVKAEGEEEEKKEDEPAPSNASAKKPAIRAKRKTAVNEAEFAAKAAAAAVREATVAEAKRHAAINRLAATYGNPEIKVKKGEAEESVPFALHAIGEGWSEQKAKGEMLEVVRDRPSGPGVIVKSHDKDCSIQALQAAMLLRAGGKLDHKAYSTPQALNFNVPSFLRRGLNDADRDRFMNAAHHYRDMSLVDLCRECLRIDGKTIPSTREETIKAAFSGSALTNIFTTDVNAILLPAYMEAEDTTAGWIMEEDVADYNLMDRPRMNIGSGLVELPEGGTADHASWSDTKEQYRAHRFAKQWVIDEIAIINDRLDALSDIPRRFGEATAWLRPDMVYGELLANTALNQDSTALFSATHPNPTQANLLTAAALTSATLKAAIKAQYLFTERNGAEGTDKSLNLRTTHLIVPPSLKWTGLELLNSGQIVIAGTAGSVTERGNANTLQQENLKLVVDSRLENGVTHPVSRTVHTGSATTWFTASTLAHTMVVGYLRGTGRAPRVRSGQLDRGQFGMWFDVQHAIGVKPLDWRGFVKNTA